MRKMFFLCSIFTLFFSGFLNSIYCSNCCVKCDDSSSGFFVKGDLLYWQGRQEGLDFLVNTRTGTFVVTEDEEFTFAETGNTNSEFHPLHFDWRCGYRIEAGYETECGWGILAKWTDYKGRAHDEQSEEYSSAEGDWKLNYQVADLILAFPNNCLGSCFKYNWFTGVRFAEITQKIDSSSADQTTFVNPFDVGTTSVSNNTNINNTHLRFDGIGPELGIKTNWSLGNCYSIYANGLAAVLYGRYHSKNFNEFINVDITTRDEIPFTRTTNFSDSSKVHGEVCQVLLEFALGLSWQYNFCSTEVELDLGWEHIQWFDFAGGRGDLCLDGLTLSAMVKF